MQIHDTLTELKHGVKYVEFVRHSTKLVEVCWKAFEAEPVVCKVVHVKLGITSILKTENLLKFPKFVFSFILSNFTFLKRRILDAY